MLTTIALLALSAAPLQERKIQSTGSTAAREKAQQEEQQKPQPVRAKPIGSPATWVMASDYPAESRAAGESGSVTTRIEVDATGKVTGCTVATSSGYPRLDQKTCELVMQRGKYEPALSPKGKAIPSTSMLRFAWSATSGS